MNETFLNFGWTIRINTAQSDFLIQSDEFTFTSWALFWHKKFFFRTCSFFKNNVNNLRNDITSFFNNDLITETNIFFINEIFIMQRSALYCCTVDLNVSLNICWYDYSIYSYTSFDIF